jgi:hypothetical protein
MVSWKDHVQAEPDGEIQQKIDGTTKKAPAPRPVQGLT